MKTICQAFRHVVDFAPDSIAVHHRGRNASYGEIARLAGAVSAWLRQNRIRHGDRVAILVPNSVDYVAWYLGSMQVGAIVVALNPETTAAELAHLLLDSEPAVVVVSRAAEAPLAEVVDQIPSLRRIVHVERMPDDAPRGAAAHVILPEVFETTASSPSTRPSPDDVAQLIYTSGTTGRPKGVTLTHANISANGRSIVDYLELSPRDAAFVILPFYYSYGNSVLFTHLAVGGRLILASDFVFWNRALDLLESQSATGFAGVPSSFAMLLHRSDLHKRRLETLRYYTCAGGGLAPAVVDRLRAAMPQARPFLMYGQTEATARLSTLLPEDLDRKPGSIGCGIPGVDLSVLNERGQRVAPGEPGEIVARGENIMQGYWRDPDASAEVLRPEGLRTGDLARIDEDGYLYIIGRKNDLIKSGAYRISPKELEDAILQLDGIAEAAVAGLPDAILGEVAVAFVVAVSEQPAPTVERIMDHCRRLLPRYKLPREVHYVRSLPKTANGKLRRGELARMLPKGNVPSSDD